MSRPVVLFLCTGNSARSQMAEAILRHRAGDLFNARSAGLAPKDINPLTLRVLEEAGIDTRGLQSKGTREFLGKVSVHYAVIVCEAANRNCPRIQPFALNTLYWPFEDPAALEGPDDQKLAKFREVRDQIDTQIQTWLNGYAADSIRG